MNLKNIAFIAVLTLGIGVVDSARGALIMSVTDAGAGRSRFVFSGSARLASGTNQSPNSIWVRNTGWNGGATPFAASGFSQGVISGAGTVTSSGSTSGAVVDVYLDHNFGFAPRVSGGIIRHSAGDLLSWSGDVVAAQAFSNFNPGQYVTRNLMFGVILNDDYILNIGPQQTEVPEPGTLAIWSLLGLGAFVYRRRRK